MTAVKMQGEFSDVLARVSADPKGHALATVLKAIESEAGRSKVIISSDMRRATLNLSNGKTATVRVTSGEYIGQSGYLRFRFKRPAELGRYEHLYFGGLGGNGKTIVRRFTPSEIGHLKTITIRGA
jgi:hypothetical protein